MSQISRQVNDIRACLSLLSIPIFIVASLAVFARPKGTFADITLVSPLPILAALGILPVVGPFFIFTLEVIGTARILATVHPHASPTGGHDGQTRKLLLLRYIFATGLSRLSLWEVFDRLRGIYNFIFPGSNTRSTISKLVRVPPATLNVLEKLGVVTALALIDDELVCEPHSIPQQLLIPSGRGMKLLDLCPEYDNESVNDSVSDDMTARRRGKSFDSDSESDDSREKVHGKLLHRKLLRRRGIRRPKGVVTSVDTVVPESFDVQFEEPNWWQHLPSLKCIGLACLLTDRKKISEDSDSRVQELRGEISSDDTVVDGAKKALARLICDQRQSQQLQSLAECIGFSTQLNSLGDQGDISPFSEELRLHVLSHNLFRERLEIDAHERSSEQSRWWGLIRPDATSVVVKDDRTHSYQLLTVGDPTIVTNLCNEAWQGEISTILPLAASDKQTIIETTNNWKLADLDVAAFCYSPVPLTLENWLASGARPQVS